MPKGQREIVLRAVVIETGRLQDKYQDIAYLEGQLCSGFFHWNGREIVKKLNLKKGDVVLVSIRKIVIRAR